MAFFLVTLQGRTAGKKALKLYIPIKSDTVQITAWLAKGINYKESFYFQLDTLFLREVSVIITHFTFNQNKDYLLQH